MIHKIPPQSSNVTGSTIASFLGILVCPSCVPAVAAFVAANAPWAFQYWKIAYFKPLFLVAMAISLTGLFLSYRRHKNFLPQILAVASAVAFYVIIFVKFYTISYGWWVWLPAIGLLAASALNLVFERRCATCRVTAN